MIKAAKTMMKMMIRKKQQKYFISRRKLLFLIRFHGNLSWRGRCLSIWREVPCSRGNTGLPLAHFPVCWSASGTWTGNSQSRLLETEGLLPTHLESSDPWLWCHWLIAVSLLVCLVHILIDDVDADKAFQAVSNNNSPPTTSSLSPPSLFWQIWICGCHEL